MYRWTLAVFVLLLVVVSGCARDEPGSSPVEGASESTATAVTISTTAPATVTVPMSSTTEPTAAGPTTTAPVREVDRCVGVSVAAVDQFVVLSVESSDGWVAHVLCDETTGEQTELPRLSRSLRCDEAGVAIRDFELPTSVRQPILRWTESRQGVVTEGEELHLRADYRAVAEVVTSSCGGWMSPPPIFRAAVFVLSLLFEELGFTEVEGDHAIDPTWAAAGIHAGQQYSVLIDLAYEGQYDPQKEWMSDCEIGLLAFTPPPSPELLADLIDAAGCMP